mmetsp:Transcript_19964/g.42976  ORF Transcript_19964/g.42976 Transcript_19964/m.42976 type:complete len:1164 (+) Transcript_19964:264-3755(+)
MKVASLLSFPWIALAIMLLTEVKAQSSSPTRKFSMPPTKEPTQLPTKQTTSPSASPSDVPSIHSTNHPSSSPSEHPSISQNPTISTSPTLSLAPTISSAPVFVAKEVCANFIGEILQSDIKASDEFGYSLKVDKENGKLAVLGAPGTDGGKGAIYIYTYVSNLWILSKKFASSIDNERMGHSVAIGENIIVAGAPGAEANKGKVYIYESLSTGDFVARNNLFGDDAGSNFGFSVDVYNKRIVVGAPGTNSGVGAVSLYRTVNDINNFVLWKTLQPNDSFPTGVFNSYGFSVAMHGNALVVGETGAGTNSGGSAFVYNVVTDWKFYQLLQAGSSTDVFGVSVDLYTDDKSLMSTIVVGSIAKDRSNSRAFVYTNPLGKPFEVQQALTYAPSKAFGKTVSVHGDYIAIGGPENNGAFFFYRENDVWKGAQLTTPRGLGSDAMYGSAVSVGENGHLLIGASSSDFSGVNSGAVFRYEIENTCGDRTNAPVTNRPTTSSPTTRPPSNSPLTLETLDPTLAPSLAPTIKPTNGDSLEPTLTPSLAPTLSTKNPTNSQETDRPTQIPTSVSLDPTLSPTETTPDNPFTPQPTTDEGSTPNNPFTTQPTDDSVTDSPSVSSTSPEPTRSAPLPMTSNPPTISSPANNITSSPSTLSSDDTFSPTSMNSNTTSEDTSSPTMPNSINPAPPIDTTNSPTTGSDASNSMSPSAQPSEPAGPLPGTITPPPKVSPLDTPAPSPSTPDIVCLPPQQGSMKTLSKALPFASARTSLFAKSGKSTKTPQTESSYKLFGKATNRGFVLFDKKRVIGEARNFNARAKTERPDNDVIVEAVSMPDLDSCFREPDPYRTCIYRSTNLGNCDRFARAEPSSRGKEEEIISGTMHLTLLQDDGSLNVTCKNMVQIEKAMLTFLADNMGGVDDEFEPTCVYTTSVAYDSQDVPDSTEFVDSKALEMEVTFVQKNGARRGLQAMDNCTAPERAMCCTQHVLNGGDIGDYCSTLACDLTQCGSGRVPRQVRRGLRSTTRHNEAALADSKRKLSSKGSKASFLYSSKTSKGKSGKGKSSKAGYYTAQPQPDAEEYVIPVEEVVPNECSWYGLLNGDDFNSVVRKYSEFKPEMTRAILGATVTEAVEKCCANRFSIDKYGTPSLTCDEYDNEDCPNNEDLKAQRLLSA